MLQLKELLDQTFLGVDAIEEGYDAFVLDSDMEVEQLAAYRLVEDSTPVPYG